MVILLARSLVLKDLFDALLSVGKHRVAGLVVVEGVGAACQAGQPIAGVLDAVSARRRLDGVHGVEVTAELLREVAQAAGSVGTLGYVIQGFNSLGGLGLMLGVGHLALVVVIA